MYGMGTASIAVSLNCSIEEADSIKSGFFKEFPKVEKWIKETELNAHKNGYVEDVWGRRRRLPDLLLNRYDVSSDSNSTDFNPLLYANGIVSNENTKLIESYRKKIESCKYKKDSDKVKAEALKDGIKIKDNTGYIAQAERQCVNARIQGGAASMSKRAMINVYNDEVLKNLGFRLLIAVHDELIGECPEENKEQVKERLSQMMIQSALPEVTVPMKCDTDDFKSWYLDVYTSEVKKQFKELSEIMGNDALDEICIERRECTREQIESMINS